MKYPRVNPDFGRSNRYRLAGYLCQSNLTGFLLANLAQPKKDVSIQREEFNRIQL